MWTCLEVAPKVLMDAYNITGHEPIPIPGMRNIQSYYQYQEWTNLTALKVFCQKFTPDIPPENCTVEHFVGSQNPTGSTAPFDMTESEISTHNTLWESAEELKRGRTVKQLMSQIMTKISVHRGLYSRKKSSRRRPTLLLFRCRMGCS